MALQTAVKFLERLEREETLRTQMYISNPDDLDKLVQFAHGKGFVCRREDMSTAIAQYKPRLKSGNLEPLKQLLTGNN